MKLAVHDLLTRSEDQTIESIYQETKDLVQKAEDMGYHRYVFAEHHGFTEHASSAPEILASYFAGITSKMRIGVAGVMIMHYAALKIAEQFKTLTALAGNRIDLGLGRAPGSSMNEAIALREGRRDSIPDFEAYLYDKIEDIMAFIADETPKSRLYKYVKAAPYPLKNLPEIWMLGSTGSTADFAAKKGMAYSHAKFFSVETPAQIFHDYKRNFIPSAYFDKPVLSFSYRVIVADTEEEANYLAKPMEYFHLRSKRLDPSFRIDPEEVKDIEFTTDELAKLKRNYDKRFMIKGSRDQVRRILEDEIEKFGLDELMFYIPLYNHETRVNNYKILSELFA